MSAFSNVCAAVERVTRVRRRLARKLIADCPVCGRRRRLEVADADSGKVVVKCHGGCSQEAVREAIGLPWSAYFVDVSYGAPQGKSAMDLVLGAISGARWTVLTHDFGDDHELALAVEILERLLPAREAVRDYLRTHSGRRLDWYEFPLTVTFVQALTGKLGHKVGEHLAARLIKLLVAYGIIERVGSFSVERDGKPTRYPIYKLSYRYERFWSERLRKALNRSRISASRIYEPPDPTTTTRLSAPEQMSSLGSSIAEVLGGLQEAGAALRRGPPAAGARA